ncbi:cellulose synthase-like protein G3 [Malania oleifera]|uniref:cellulose synthase-like protein G3 n=1 Tax=Malania oleifera TaxID=397392 RepID=UPI0025ADD1B4|nr:cellulose synthase-like protein G3 [Malania oleifera]
MEAAPHCATPSPPLHTLRLMRRTIPNRVFAAVYVSAVVALFYHHTVALLHSTTGLASAATRLCLLAADAVLGFMWVTTQAFRMRPVSRREFPEALLGGPAAAWGEGFPALDVFVCTADPFKEPPMSLVNTALSVMAYEYPTEKVAVYVSDDGGSELTLFALMEAASFAKHWLPFCREKKVVERSPEVYFRSNMDAWCSETHNIKMMYQDMKDKVESVVEKGRVGEEYIATKAQRQAFTKWTHEFTRQHHPTVIQVLLESEKDEDDRGQMMPNLIYVSRQKSRNSPHHFKAGALNVLLRVSATMTNAPILLTLDCDTYSNDPKTPLRFLCYHFDSAIRPTLGFIQFPQRFHGINKRDTYACEYKRLFQINPLGMDGLSGPNYVGTGCFFHRRAFFGGPSSFVQPEIPELSPNHVADKPIQSSRVLALAHNVASCDYENHTTWGYKMGFKYGSFVEDYYTGYRLQCEGWKSIFCSPERAAFLGDIPISLNDMLNQCKRWAVGLLEVAFSKYNPLTFGFRSMGPLMGLAYAHYTGWPFWSLALTTYAFLPQLALLNGISIFPKVCDPWFLLYAFLFLGSYTQDFLDFISLGGTLQKWWSDQRMWLARGLSCFLFGLLEFLLKSLGIPSHGFNITSKVLDDEQSKRYDREVFEFGIASPMFVPLAMAAIINLLSFIWGFTEVFGKGGTSFVGLFGVQMFIAGFVVVNCWPIYEAMVLRSDKGRMPTRTTIVSAFLVWALYMAASLILKV